MQSKSRHRSDEEWIRLVEDCQQSSISTAEWCRRNDIKIPTLYAVMKRLKSEGVEIPKKKKFETVVHGEDEGNKPKRDDYHNEVVIRTDDGTFESASCAIEIKMGRVHLKVNNGTDPALLSEMMNILRKEA